MMRSVLIFISFYQFIVQGIFAQTTPVNPQLMKGYWPSSWISCPDISQRDYGVYHFRKSFDLNEKPEKFIVHVTADNRYRLFVNGVAVVSGPARGDLANWYFETVDIGSYLQRGKNIVAALVWNMGEYAAVAQVSNQTGFVLQGDGPAEQVINSDASWKVMQNNAYSPVSTDNTERLGAYMVVGPGDQVDASHFPWNWEKPEFDDSQWQYARKLVNNPVTHGYGTDNLWTLKPRNIPFMQEVMQRIPTVRRVRGLQGAAKFIDGRTPLRIPPHQKVSILLDQSVNTVAYPELIVSQGKGAHIKMTYAESLYDATGNKGNRNEIDGKEIKGNYDVFLPDGGSLRSFRPLWFKTYRYVQLDIETLDETLVLNDLYGMKTGYPFELKATFTSNDPNLTKIWDVGWRTQLICAGETYFDTPYYEQLQYEGDTRIQALITLYMSGDDRLMRKALLDFYNSKTPEGLPQGRYPSNRLQVIPTFSLFWVSMVYDYWMHRQDDEFVKQFLPSVQQVLAWYVSNMDKEKGMLGPMKWWNFVDWDAFDLWGVPEGAEDGNSAIISLQLAYTLKQAQALFAYFGEETQAQKYETLSHNLNSKTYEHAFDKDRMLMANSPLKETYSQHASILAILSGAVQGDEARTVFEKLTTDDSISKVTFFYRFYLIRAMKEVGLADRYYAQLDPWWKMLDMGLTTFAEKPEPTRTDSHAWSSSPNYDFLATIIGIMPASPGFKSVLIQPGLGELKEAEGSMPHPNGTIKVKLKRNGSGIKGTVSLPDDVDGTFKFGGKEIKLQGGTNSITL
ncbi:alpha-L-rhamnosidase-related protein [Sphingobacterium olei]|nr:alpha-L-rhamnosidase C-terminal domain-containing protein [Sphingobacterium olei]